MKEIIIKGANQGNLKNISLRIPRDKMVVFTGLSGSGKSTLAVDTIFNECQRQYLEAMGMQGIQKPDVEVMENLSPAILISQNQYNKNPRSSVGTVTDIYTDLRMIYEKLAQRKCPHCGEAIVSYECREEVEKSKDGFTVYMYCSSCNHKMLKLTRSHFSFNTREGACEKCHGLGEILELNEESVINQELSLEDGAVDFWTHQYKEYSIDMVYTAFKHYGVPSKPGVKVKDFSEGQKAILFWGAESDQVKKLFPEVAVPKTVSSGKFEGIFTVLWRRLSENGGDTSKLLNYFVKGTCPQCQGEKLNPLSRSVTVMGKGITEVSSLSLEELYMWIEELEKNFNEAGRVYVESYILDLKTKLRRIINVGLGYLTLDRQTNTLSGGEAQRIKLAATLDSTMTGLIYIMDEPTIGLHPKDTLGIIKVMKELRDKGNTVIVIEHDTDVMREADYIVDIGPGSGKHGGEIIAQGNLEELLNDENSVTGAYLRNEGASTRKPRKGNGTFIEVRNATEHNLKGIDVNFPIGCLTSVTGVSGSGKSTLVFDILSKGDSEKPTGNNVVSGTDSFKEIIIVEQSPLTRMKRSNVATYSGVYSEIRKIFGSLEEAKNKGLTSKEFSFNSKGGRCENCEGLGYVVSNMLFFKDIEVICPVCEGNQFNDEVLSVKYKGYSIKDILRMSIEEAIPVFEDEPKILKILKMLQDVGLDYLELGQTLTTLSGGEGQRLKLARELIEKKGKNNLYLIDEPTTGLHPVDVENFLKLLNKMVDSGNTVIVVEHNQQVIKDSDWIIDLGPEGGVNGGDLMAVGTPLDIVSNGKSITGKYL